MRAEQLVQLAEARIVAGQADVQQFRPFPELDARHGADAVLGSQAHEIGDAGGGMDIGEGEGAHAGLGGLLQQGLRLEQAVLEAEPAVRVEEHDRRFFRRFPDV